MPDEHATDILCAIHDNKDGTVTMSFESGDPQVAPCEHRITLNNLRNLAAWLKKNMPEMVA